MKKISLTLVVLSFLFIGQMGVAGFQEDGPYLEMDEPSGNNFFMLDVEDIDFGTDAVIPDRAPVEGVITSGFGWRRYSRRSRRGRMHKGLDIAAPRGTPIVATAPGKVFFVGRKGGYGKTVILSHGGTLSTLYAHNSKIMVEEGDFVVRGQEISAVGNSGRSTGPHLHYEVRVEGVPVNPKRYF